jgi:threonine synthase
MQLPTDPRDGAVRTGPGFGPGSTVSLPSAIVCGGCGTVVEPSEPYPFRCPRTGDGGDHVLRRVLDVSRLAFAVDAEEANPFVRWRELSHAYHLATDRGMSDEAFVAVVRRLDSEVASVDGHGFVATPFTTSALLAERLGTSATVWVKDETGNVAGSHKARHLFGLLVHLEVVRLLGMTAGPLPPLAIASCGNAALAAAVVAAAGHRRLLVFVPTDADPVVLERLASLGAEITVCPRVKDMAGDPTYQRLQVAISEGALPFTCQGNENGLVIEGGETIGYEMAAGLPAPGRLEHVVIQVGGGALASAVAQSLSEATAFGVLTGVPRVHTVQTESAWPLARAFARIAGRLSANPGTDEIHAAVRFAATHRSEFMWPWESVPHSLAHGIVDDETYDWLAVVEAMLATGGQALVVNEDEISQANRLAVEATGIGVDPTGSAGLAGLAQLCRRGVIGSHEQAAVLFTGARR